MRLLCSFLSKRKNQLLLTKGPRDLNVLFTTLANSVTLSINKSTRQFNQFLFTKGPGDLNVLFSTFANSVTLSITKSTRQFSGMLLIDTLVYAYSTDI